MIIDSWKCEEHKKITFTIIFDDRCEKKYRVQNSIAIGYRTVENVIGWYATLVEAKKVCVDFRNFVFKIGSNAVEK